jgi:hypothetical protein
MPEVQLALLLTSTLPAPAASSSLALCGWQHGQWCFSTMSCMLWGSCVCRRALKLWFVLRMYGTDNLAALVRHHLELAEWFAAAVRADGRFEVVTPPRFGLTCFRLAGVDRSVNQELLERVNASGGLGLRTRGERVVVQQMLALGLLTQQLHTVLGKGEGQRCICSGSSGCCASIQPSCGVHSAGLPMNWQGRGLPSPLSPAHSHVCVRRGRLHDCD